MHETDDACFRFHTNILIGNFRYPGDYESEASDRLELVLNGIAIDSLRSVIELWRTTTMFSGRFEDHKAMQ